MKDFTLTKNGFTIIEMMIGMLIAMLCVIILLMLFKQISGVAGTASRNAEYDAQLENGTLIIQKLVQNAGYGLAPSTASPATADIVPTTQMLYWRIQPTIGNTSSIECYRIKEEVSPDASNASRDIHLITIAKKSSCGRDTNMTTLTEAQWTTAPVESIIRLYSNHPTNADGSLKPASTVSDPVFSYTTFNNCKPFGIQGINASKGLTINARRLDVSLGSTGDSIVRSVCLNNLR